MHSIIIAEHLLNGNKYRAHQRGRAKARANVRAARVKSKSEIRVRVTGGGSERSSV
jgi:hypothetical protein